ncbi:hypothetical protein WR25_00162 [Diploscapter pachys]|uniref:Uncharacterized protein n=1 Tax=Diploscapter pachys TaxID=2018661 RepID=A0A2A2JLH9_9BILA|nr:hypothetical protein WR25_00162 [Diploscapter pachys]
MRLLCISHLLVLWTASAFAQSIDEEETVHLGVGSSVKEGSADTALSDDEDFEGSALPPESQYAKTPQVHPKATTQATGKIQQQTTKQATTIVKQKVSPLAVTTPISSILDEEESNISSSSSSIIWTHGIAILLAAILLILFTLIVIIICCKAYHRRKQAYRPGQRLSPDALLKE